MSAPTVADLEVTVRDAVLAAVASFAGAIAVSNGNVTKSVIVAAAYTALRVAAGLVANRLSR